MVSGTILFVILILWSLRRFLIPLISKWEFIFVSTGAIITALGAIILFFIGIREFSHTHKPLPKLDALYLNISAQNGVTPSSSEWEILFNEYGSQALVGSVEEVSAKIKELLQDKLGLKVDQVELRENTLYVDYSYQSPIAYYSKDWGLSSCGKKIYIAPHERYKKLPEIITGHKGKHYDEEISTRFINECKFEGWSLKNLSFSDEKQIKNDEGKIELDASYLEFVALFQNDLKPCLQIFIRMLYKPGYRDVLSRGHQQGIASLFKNEYFNELLSEYHPIWDKGNLVIDLRLDGVVYMALVQRMENEKI